MPVIDWLELLWKAAEEGGTNLLPEEPDLLSVKAGEMSRTGENGETTSAQSFAAELETQIPAWNAPSRFETTGLLGDVELPETAEHLGAAEQEKSHLHSLLRDVRSQIDGGAERQIQRSAAESALTLLYRRVRETVSSEKPEKPNHNSMVVVREEVPATSGLTEERLDRSLRRDSRRYDGGMSIY